MRKTTISLALIAVAVAGCGGERLTEQTRPPEHGDVVNGLRLSVSAEKDTWKRFDDIRLTIELENVADEKRVVPGRFCGQVRWLIAAEIQVRTPSGTLLKCLVGSGSDTAHVHRHGPFTLAPKASSKETVMPKQLFEMHLGEIPGALDEPGRFTVWAQLESKAGDAILPGGRPWAGYYPSIGGFSLQKEQPEEFKNTWPSWAWKGKLTSNVIHLTVRK